MRIPLTPEQERRISSITERGDYDSVEEVVEAGLSALEQRTIPGFEGSQEELEALLLEGLASKTLSETEFWDAVHRKTAKLIEEHEHGQRR